MEAPGAFANPQSSGIMRTFFPVRILLFAGLTLGLFQTVGTASGEAQSQAVTGGASPLDVGWANPPRDARVRAYWWWLNGNVTRESITRDLEEMKAKGLSLIHI